MNDITKESLRKAGGNYVKSLENYANACRDLTKALKRLKIRQNFRGVNPVIYKQLQGKSIQKYTI